MKQFLLPSDYTGGRTVRIAGDQYHYLKHVLRFEKGKSLSGRDKDGKAYHLEVEQEGVDELILSVKSRPREKDLQCQITLFQCLPKGAGMDRIVRQATEIGVSRIAPLISERTIVNLGESNRITRRLVRWNRIAREALQQSGSANIPQLDIPIHLQDVPDLKLQCSVVFHPQASCDANLHSLLATAPDHVNIAIGPEGGFSSEEIDLLNSRGFQSVVLGETILRVDTAAVFALSVVQLLLWEQKNWQTK